METILANWEYVMLGLYAAEKIVKVTPCKWDDIIVDGIRSIVNLKSSKQK